MLRKTATILAVLIILGVLCRFTALSEDRVVYEWHFEVVWENLPFLIGGVGMTVIVAIASMILGLVVGMIAALARLSGNTSLMRLAEAYVEFFRTTPMLVQLFWVYYCLPIIFNVGLDPFASGILALGLNSGAFFSEIFRAGITSISKGQTEAAMALGMTRVQTMRRIILPQAITRMLPPIGSNWISLIKDTSLVSAIALADLTYRGRTLSAITFRPLEILTAIAVMYFILTYPQAMLVNWMHRKYLTAE